MQIWPWLCLALIAGSASAQTVSDTSLPASINAKTLQDVNKLSRQTEKMTVSLQQQSNQVLTQLESKELSLQREIQKKDSAATNLTSKGLAGGVSALDPGHLEMAAL